MSAQLLTLAIDGNSITQDESGLFSINDLFKSSGGEDKHSPRRWQQLVRTKSLISELKSESDNDGISVIKSDKKAGTFVCTELVYAYAMAISPKFEVKVIRGFHAAAAEEHRLAKLHGTAAWQQDRELGKYQRKGLTAEIKQYIAYAKTQGSKGADNYYNLITRTVNIAIGIDSRDEVDENKLHRLATAEEIVAKCLLDGMASCLPYKQIYKTLKIRLDELREALPVEEAA